MKQLSEKVIKAREVIHEIGWPDLAGCVLKIRETIRNVDGTAITLGEAKELYDQATATMGECAKACANCVHKKVWDSAASASGYTLECTSEKVKEAVDGRFIRDPGFWCRYFEHVIPARSKMPVEGCSVPKQYDPFDL